MDQQSARDVHLAVSISVIWRSGDLFHCFSNFESLRQRCLWPQPFVLAGYPRGQSRNRWEKCLPAALMVALPTGYVVLSQLFLNWTSAAADTCAETNSSKSRKSLWRSAPGLVSLGKG